MGAFGSNFGSNFSAFALSDPVGTVPATKKITTELCVTTSSKVDLCV